MLTASMLRRLGRAAVAAVLLAAGSAPALINPNFTPLDLVEQSRLILRLRVGPPGKDASLNVDVLKALKGPAGGRTVVIDLSKADIEQSGAFRKALGEKPREALLFSGQYVEQGKEAQADEPSTGVAGLLHVGGHWYRLLKPAPDAAWLFDAMDTDREGCFAGGTDMLDRMVQYILSDPRATVPAGDGVTWRAPKLVGKVDGEANAATAVDLGDGKIGVWVASAGGDRLWQFAADGAAGDAGERMKLRARSRAGAWGDFDGDARADLLSWDGAAWTLWTRSAGGQLDPRPLKLRTTGPCLGVSALGGGGRCGAVVSTPGLPVLLRPRPDGGWDETPLAADLPAYDKARAEFGNPAECLLADLDGDCLADVLQPFEKGSLVFAGRTDGSFAPPTACGEAGTGPAPAAACLGDFDADGLLDVLVAGQAGCSLWQNRGKLQFVEAMGASGEPAYVTKPGACGGATCDVNNDGRQDFLVTYRDRAPQVFFNRGFRSFGHAHGLDVQEGALLPAAEKGTRAAPVADLNADGAQDMLLVLPDGQAWVFFRNVPAGAAASLTVAAAANAGPITVTGWRDKRCLGAWNVAAASPGAFFAAETRGPITIGWTIPPAAGQDKKLIILKPTRFVLPR